MISISCDWLTQKRRERRAHEQIGVLMLALVASSGCAATSYLKHYEGPELADSEIARVYCSYLAWLPNESREGRKDGIEGQYVVSINGERHKVGTFGRIDLRPGQYQLEVAYDAMSGPGTRLVSPDPATVDFVAEAGRRYVLRAEENLKDKSVRHSVVPIPPEVDVAEGTRRYQTELQGAIKTLIMVR